MSQDPRKNRARKRRLRLRQEAWEASRSITIPIPGFPSHYSLFIPGRVVIQRHIDGFRTFSAVITYKE